MSEKLTKKEFDEKYNYKPTKERCCFNCRRCMRQWDMRLLCRHSIRRTGGVNVFAHHICDEFESDVL